MSATIVLKYGEYVAVYVYQRPSTGTLLVTDRRSRNRTYYRRPFDIADELTRWAAPQSKYARTHCGRRSSDPLPQEVIKYTDWLTLSNETKRWTLVAIAIEAVKEHNEHRKEVRDTPHLFPLCIPPRAFHFTGWELMEGIGMEFSGLLQTLLNIVDTHNFASGVRHPFHFEYFGYNLSLDSMELARWFANVPSVRNIPHREIQEVVHLCQSLRRKSAQRRWRRFARNFVRSNIINYIKHRIRQSRVRAEARMHAIAVHEAWIASIEQDAEAPQE